MCDLWTNQINDVISMVAEMLQKYIFMFNIFLSKKLCIFIFNQKIILVL